MLKLIPAIDLKNGWVVRANAGERKSYRPLATPLFPSAIPKKVLEFLYRRLQFRTFYFADLDAIMQTGNNQKIILKFLETHTDTVCWVDAGVRRQHDYLQLKKLHPNIIPIIPTETLCDIALLKTAAGDNYILSLDFRNHRLLGIREILEQYDDWPKTVIALSLDAIGSNTPDFTVLNQALRHQRQNRRKNELKRQVFFGGGVRNGEDLRTIRKAGAAGVLIAAALYDGVLP